MWGTSRSGHPPKADGLDAASWVAWQAEDSELPPWPAEQLDGVIHLAQERGQGGDSLSGGRASVVTTLALLERARRDGLALVLAGSGDCVAGGSPIASEDDPNIAPLSYYGACKGAMELLARPHWQAGHAVCVVRPVHPFGPGGDAFLINRLAQRVLGSVPIIIEGPDGILTNPVWITDAAAGFVAAIERRARGLYQLGGEQTVSLRELIGQIAALLGKAASIEVVDKPPPGGHAGTWCRARSELGWSPKVGLHDGLARLVQSLGD